MCVRRLDVLNRPLLFLTRWIWVVQMQNKEDQLWKEYAMLREEIKSADTLKYQIMGIAVGAVGAILVASFNQSNFLVRSLVALCAYIITIPAYRQRHRLAGLARCLP